MLHVKPLRWLAALALLGAGPALAQEAALAEGEVRLTAPGLAVTGTVLGFDGRYLRIAAPEGELTLDLSAVACEGACPEAGETVPVLRLSGDAGVGAVLLPALVEGFAEAQGWTVARDGDVFVLREGEAEAFRIALRLSTTEDGIADLLASEADLALVARAPLPDEAARLEEAGEPRLRPLAMDALVPVTGPGQRVGRVTLEQVAAAFAGEVESWAALGGEDAPIRLHLGPADGAPAQAFEALVLGATGRTLSADVVRHASDAEAAVAVAADPQALGVLPFGALGGAQPLVLTGRCGLPWEARAGAVRAGDHPLAVPLALLQPMRRLSGPAQDFVGWLATPDAQVVLRRAGVVGAEAVPIPWAEQGERLAAAIRASGPEVPLRELQRLVRVLGPFTRASTTFRFEEGTRLDPLSRGLVLRLAHEIAEGRHAGRTLVLAGFSDRRGDADENRRLSLRRAEAVEAALLEALGGALPDGLRLRVHAFGEALPIGCDDEADGPWGLGVNRRVELWVSG